MTELERRALTGDKQAQEECTRQGIVLPCPCCGSEAIKGNDCDDDSYQWWGSIYCKNCWIELNGVHTICKSEAVVTEEMVKQWNTRPAPPIGRCGECAHRYKGHCVSGPCAAEETDADFYCGNFKEKENKDNALL